MIYTGYFAKIKEYEKDGLLPISIAGKAPVFYHGIQYKAFAPKYTFFALWKAGEISNEVYTERFKAEVLDTLDKDKVLSYLESFNRDIVLLCYEKSEDFCHRHLVASWIKEVYNIDVVEYSCHK